MKECLASHLSAASYSILWPFVSKSAHLEVGLLTALKKTNFVDGKYFLCYKPPQWIGFFLGDHDACELTRKRTDLLRIGLEGRA